MLLIGTWADSDVYQSECWWWVYKIYRDLSVWDVVRYQEVQNDFSWRLVKKDWFLYQKIKLWKLRSPKTHISILDYNTSELISGEKLWDSFRNWVVSKVPYIWWVSIDNLDENDLYTPFHVAEIVRDYLREIIGFPNAVDINPCNIKLVESNDTIPHLIITDIAAEIQCLLEQV